MLLNELGAFSVPQTRAAESASNSYSSIIQSAFKSLASVLPKSANKVSASKLGIVAILAENSLLDDKTAYSVNGSSATLREYIFQYAQNVQKRMPHTRAIVIGVDPDDSVFRISTILEKMYFEGADNDFLNTNKGSLTGNDNNHLAGIVLVGNIPTPVVYQEDGAVTPSMYPYTDFYQKRFVYNHNTGHFEENNAVIKPTPEIWHGVIVPPSKDDSKRKQEIADYFYKNNQYSNNLGGYNEFNKRLLYYNFPAIEKNLNVLDYNNYKRFILFLEEIAFHRYNINLLHEMLKGVEAEMEPEKSPSERTPIIDEESIKNMVGSGVELTFKKYTINFASTLKTYLGKLNTQIAQTGRWGEKDYDSLASLITLRDTYMQNTITAKQIQMENQVNEAIAAVQQNIDIINSATVTVSSSHDGTQRQFIFKASTKGTIIDNIKNTGDCGLIRGQQRPKGVSTLVNNSVIVEANRTYNPDTAVIPKDKQKVTDTNDYKGYAGCVANNAFKVETDDKNIKIGPEYCRPNDSFGPVIDMAGSKELNFTPYNPSDTPPKDIFIPIQEQCPLEDLGFIQSPPPKGFLDGKNANLFDLYAYNVGVFSGNRNLHATTDNLYNSMRSSGEITAKEGAADTTLQSRFARIVQKILKTWPECEKTPTGCTRTFNDSGVLVYFNVKPTIRSVKTEVPHIEPADSTISAACSTQLTGTLPSDGIRYVEFYKKDKIQPLAKAPFGGILTAIKPKITRVFYKYPNLFRVPGITADEVQKNLLAMVKEKDDELNGLLDSQQNVITKFLLANSDLVEPMLWRNMSIDQKHKAILDKYLNRDSFMPVPDATAVPPSTKPLGYEVMHIYADGDENEIRFGINASKIAQSETPDKEIEGVKKPSGGTGSGTNTPSGGTSSSGQNNTDKMFKCGPADGVQVWDWFPQVIGCWIPDEITKLSNAIGLDSSCTGGGITTPEPEPQDDILDETEDPSLSESNPAHKPVTLEMSAGKKTLVRGEETWVKVKVLNSKGKVIAGYQEEPLKFILDNAKMGSFDENSVTVFTGESKVVLKAGEISGETNITVKMGSLSSSVKIKIVDGIKVKLSYEKEEGKPAYKISVGLVDLSGNAVTDVSTVLRLMPVNPADGKFVSDTVSVENGSGEAEFFPNPASQNIVVTSAHAVYQAGPINIPSITNDPYRIIIDAPKDIRIAEDVSIPVRVTDVYGVTSKNYSDVIQAKVTDATINFGAVQSPEVSISGGIGEIKLKVGKDTGTINLIASKEGLMSGTAPVPIVAKITEEEWGKTFPQNLFASLVGFPAGNFMKEDYFGGVHLFSGKTEAVFSFMTGIPLTPVLQVLPGFKIKGIENNKTAEVKNLDNAISLQVTDRNTLKPLLSTVMPMDFDGADIWNSGVTPSRGMIYVGLTDDSYTSKAQSGSVEIFDFEGNRSAVILKDNITLINTDLKLSLDSRSDYDFPELIISSGMGEVGRVYMVYRDRKLDPANFTFDDGYSVQPLYTGTSVNDPTGLVMYDKSEVVEDEKKIPEDFGFTGDNKYILRFGGGSPAGEAVMWNLPVNAVLLGDPTIKLQNKSVSSLNYDNTIGRQIYQDSEASNIIALTNFDFNADGIEDVAAVLKDGRIRLLQGGYTDPTYVDKGNIAYLADGVVSIASFDFKKDGYDDLVVSTKEGRLAILNNDKELITRTDQKIKVGKEVYQVIKSDMDMDGYDDLITLDSRGDIRLFYNQGNKLPENGALLGNYGFKISSANLSSDLQMRYPGMPEPASTTSSTTSVATDVVNNSSTTGSETGDYGLPTFDIPDSADLSGISNFASKDTSQSVSEAQAQALVQAQSDAAENEEYEVPKLPYADNGESESYFAQLDTSMFSAVKTVDNKDRPGSKDLDLGESLKYKIEIVPNSDINNFVLADVVPDALELNKETVKCEGTGCLQVEITQNGIYLFVAKLYPKAGKKMTITYEATVKNTPKAAIMINRLDGKTKLNAAAPLDYYKDVLVSPPYNDTGQLIVYYSVAPRRYQITTTVKEEAKAVNDAVTQNQSCMDSLNALKNLKVDKDTKLDKNFMSNVMSKCGLDKVQSDLKECKVDPSGAPVGSSPQECAENPSKCTSGALNDTANYISNFSCSGGGCFPIPYNMAFLAPKAIPGYAMPLLAFPATFPTPFGPIPVPSFFGVAPTSLGATDIAGPIMSVVRLYTIPTLTGGIGMAFCWGPYTGSAPVPPPLVPVPYPPPLGNCMAFALPMGSMPACKMIEKGITSLMQSANSVVSDANSGVAAVNNSGLPVELQRKGNTSGGAAGGLEVGLAVQLGTANKFTPPAKTFSNKHISPYDSIGGKIAGWLDRQKSEIFNKLLSLPTLRIVLPNVTNMFSTDWEEFNKLTTSWWNNVSGNTKGSVSSTANLFTNSGPEKQSAGTTFMQNYKAIEQDITAFNTSSMEDLYSIVNSIPLIKLTRQNVDFKIPYISYGQVNDLLRDFNQAKIFYNGQINKYKILIAKLKCPDTNSASSECELVRLMSAVNVNANDLITSIDENIKVIQSYLSFPRKIVTLKKEIAQYLSQLACVIQTFSQSLNGWLLTIQEQIIGYVTVYKTIIEITKNIKKLFNIFTNFSDSCDICTNDRYTNFGWYSLLGLVLPEFPIIKFPKWPDIVIDLADFKSMITLEVPEIHFIAQPIKLPKIPRIPFPDVPGIDFAAQIPAIPILPKLPDIPDMPALPAVPKIDLPTLPPPPKLPDIGKDFNVIFDLLSKLLKIWCMIKKSYTPVPEAYLKDDIVLLTNRPAYLTPLDMLQIKAADVPALETDFNELNITTKAYLGIRIKAVSEAIQKTANDWNEKLPTDWSDIFDSYIKKVTKVSEDITKGLETIVSSAQEEWENTVQAKLNEIGSTMQDFDKAYFRSAEADMQKPFDDIAELVDKKFASVNQELAGKLTDLKKWVDKQNGSLRDILRDAISSTFFKIFNNALTAGTASIAEMSDTDLGDWFQTTVLDSINSSINKATINATFDPSECSGQLDKWSTAGEPWLQDIIRQAKEANCPSETQPSSETPKPVSQNAISPELKNEFAGIYKQISDEINKINEKTPIDYKSVENYKAPDYKLPEITTAVDKLNAVRENILKQSKELTDEVAEANNTEDLYSYFQNKLEPATSEIAVKEEGSKIAALPIPGISKIVNQVSSEIKKQNIQNAVSSVSSTSSSSSSSSDGVCVGTCLVDPKTGLSVQFIPHSDNPETVQTAFIPSYVKGKSNVVYSDGPNLYLKSDLSLPPDITLNIAPLVPNIIFNLDDFLVSNGSIVPPKESINNLSTTLTENGSSNFGWMENTNPDLYGVGIELERSILGYDADKQGNGLSDVTIILLPPAIDGTTPKVTVGDKTVEYGTLVTSLTDKDEARKIFGIGAKTILTGSDTVYFQTIVNSNRYMGIKLNPLKAVYFDMYSGPGYRLNMDNGFDHIKMQWFDKSGRASNSNRSELLSPQIYASATPPIDTLQGKSFSFPVYKEGKIYAGKVFTDIASGYQYYWDTNLDGLPDTFGDELIITPQKEPKEFEVELTASIKPDDTSFPQYKKRVKVIIYTPEIILEEIPIKDSGEVKGSMTPLNQNDDLSEIPFSIFRKRWGIWKNLGILKKRRNTPTIPTISDKNGYTDNYYSIDSAGNYSVKGFTSGPSNVMVSDGTPKDVARVHLGTGQIELLDANYDVKVIPASKTLPTRASIVKKGFDTVLSNVYYVSDGNTDAVILNEPLTQSNLGNIGVTLGDDNTSDSVTAMNLPGYTESFPGGAAIFNSETQKNIAMINSDGTVRMMSVGYSLRFKNLGKFTEKVILQLVDDNGSKPIFDIFVAADFNNLVIKQDEVWNDLKTEIGYLKKKIGPMFAALTSQDPIVKKPGVASSPFPDVNSEDPNYKAILNLYQRRIISGYGDGTFRPEAKISRGEFVKIALGSTNCFDCTKPTDVQKQKYSPVAPFPDVTLPAWYYFCVSIAKELGMVTGYGDGYFRPEKNISRAEAAAILLRQSGIELQKTPEDYFLDVPSYAWYIDYVYTAVKIGLVKESNGFVFPDEEITRGEFAFMASGVLDIKDCRIVDSDKDGMPDWWEMENGLDPLYSGDADLDSDDDNFTNLQEYKNGTNPNAFDAEKALCAYIDNPNQTDTDLDGIIDVCDEDIDNDGVKNVLGIYDNSGLIDPDKIKASTDNCVFIANADQTDANNNGVGDTCEVLPPDQAGPPTDKCPNIPEDLDNYQDDDGCPEVNPPPGTTPPGTTPPGTTPPGTTPPGTPPVHTPDTPGVYVNKGPLCYFLDYENDFVKDDVIMTAITDVVTHDTIYKQSNEVTY